MKTYTPSRGILYLFCVLLATILTASAQKKVLFYGPTHAAGGVAETLIANNPTEFAQLGFGSAIWTPGHSSAALDWLQKTSNDFAAFDVIFIGEPGAPNVSSTLLQGAIANRSIWSSAVSGNIIIMTGDPQFHSGYPGAQEYIEQALRFAAADLAPGPGLYVASGLLHPAESPIDDSKGALEHLLDQIGPFSVMSHASGQNVTKFGSHPLLDTLTNEELSGWTSSAHGGLHDWPSNFRPVALVTDNSQNPVSTDTPSSKLPPGYRGLVHVVARGDIKRLTIDP